MWSTCLRVPNNDGRLIHGFGEHIGRYNEFCTFLAENGIYCHGYDQRGFGQTGKRSQQIGNNQGYHRALADINDAIHRVRNRNIPLFLFGQSMGGGLVMNFAASSEKEFDGLKEVTGIIAASPLVTLSMPISPLRYYPLQVAARIVPSFVIQAGLDFNAMSHDPKVAEELESDPLVHDYATLATGKNNKYLFSPNTRAKMRFFYISSRFFGRWQEFAHQGGPNSQTHPLFARHS